MPIHPTAMIAPGAQIPASCTVGPYCTIGPNVTLGESCDLVSHVVLEGHTTLGALQQNLLLRLPRHCPAGPQIRRRAHPPTSSVRQQLHPRVRHHFPRHRPAVAATTTRRLDGCLIMAYTHIGHDSLHRQRLHPRQLRHPRRPRHGRRFRHRRRPLPGPPVLPYRPLQLHWRRHDHHPGRPPLFPHLHRPATTTPTASTRSA